jgi:pimeloyl-ACP methyl ester carboxylesterase
MIRRHKILTLAAVTAIGTAALAFTNERAAKQAERDHPPIGKHVEVEGVRLHYVRQGSGPPVVLLHGNPGSIEDWAAVVPELSSTHEVIAFDRPGHGYSDPAAEDSGSPEVQARLLHAALSALAIERPILVGHSWGGGLILVYALHHPGEVAALVAVEPSSHPDPSNIDPIYPVLAAPVLGALVSQTLSSILGRPKIRNKLALAFSPDPVPDAYLARATAMWTRPREARATAIDNLRRHEVLTEISPRYGELRVPLVILAADQDAFVDSRGQAHRLHAQVPGSVLIPLAGAGHMLPQTRATAVVEAIRSKE